MEKGKQREGIGFFEKYLTVWVLICMAAGILIGKFLPAVPVFLGRFEYAQISIPIAVLIWIMIYPMMMKVDFQSIKDVRRNPQGLIIGRLSICSYLVPFIKSPFTSIRYPCAGWRDILRMQNGGCACHLRSALKYRASKAF